MKTLKEHNEHAKAELQMMAFAKAGVACDKCGTELLSKRISSGAIVFPTQIGVHCPECGFHGIKYGKSKKGEWI